MSQTRPSHASPTPRLADTTPRRCQASPVPGLGLVQDSPDREPVEHILDALVPEAPVVVTGTQPGDEVDAALVGRGDETAVLLDQLVLGAAVQEQSGKGGRDLGGGEAGQAGRGCQADRL